jgi:N-acetylglutamate synthase-like GNAT family acetyltransferase
MDTRLDLAPWLASVLVAPAYRRRGVGSALAERVVEEARALAVETLYLYTYDKSFLFPSWLVGA